MITVVAPPVPRPAIFTSFYCALLVALLGAALCADAQTGHSDIDGLITRVESARVKLEVPAVAVTLVSPSRVLWSGVLGVADKASGRPADAQTQFRIGSITKMFTALALLIAQDDGRLDLNTPATEIAPDFPMQNPWNSTHPVRVVHLLEHTAGLPDLSREEFDHNEPMELRAALAWKAADRRALWPPGLHHSYTNVGAGLAAYLLEQATGQGYEDFVRDRIFNPLGMNSAGFFPDPQTLVRLAKGYDTDGTTVIPYWNVLYRAFGAINVLPSDMAPFIQMLLNSGEFHGWRLVSAAAIERMETPGTTLSAGTGLRYGYGLGNYTWLRRGILFHGHGGDGDGYLARLGYSRERAMGYFVVINVFRNADLDRIRQLVEDFIVGETQPPTPPLYPIAPQRLAEYAGHYETVTSRFPRTEQSVQRGEDINIITKGNELRIQRGQRTQRLIPVTAQHFRYPGETIATSAFIEYGGRMFFQYDGGNYMKIDDRPIRRD